jgi:hypothetical protein
MNGAQMPPFVAQASTVFFTPKFSHLFKNAEQALRRFERRLYPVKRASIQFVYRKTDDAGFAVLLDYQNSSVF